MRLQSGNNRQEAIFSYMNQVWTLCWVAFSHVTQFGVGEPSGGAWVEHAGGICMLEIENSHLHQTQSITILVNLEITSTDWLQGARI